MKRPAGSRQGRRLSTVVDCCTPQTGLMDSVKSKSKNHSKAALINGKSRNEIFFGANSCNVSVSVSVSVSVKEGKLKGTALRLGDIEDPLPCGVKLRSL